MVDHTQKSQGELFLKKMNFNRPKINGKPLILRQINKLSTKPGQINSEATEIEPNLLNMNVYRKIGAQHSEKHT